MNLNRNNNYQVIYDLIGRNKKTLWKIYQEIPQEGEI